jgi:aspartyl/glutamyl-tRNA(Asn/Gln) amidotransferase C subunit
MITIEELHKIAALAKLSLDGEDIEALRNDISGVLAFADTIAQAVVEMSDENATTRRRGLRRLKDDTVRPSTIDEILSNAGERQDGILCAPRGGLVNEPIAGQRLLESKSWSCREISRCFESAENETRRWARILR